MPTPVLTGKLFLHPPEREHLAIGREEEFSTLQHSLLNLPITWIWIPLIQDQRCPWEQYSTKNIWSWWSTQLFPQPHEIHYFVSKQLCWAAASTALLRWHRNQLPAPEDWHWQRLGQVPAWKLSPGTQLTANLLLLLIELIQSCSHTNSSRRASPR